MKLGYKLAIGTIILTGASVLAVVVVANRALEKVSREDLQSKAGTLARQFISHYSDPMENGEETKLLEGLLDLARDPAVIFGMVLDGQGKIVAHTDIHRVGQFERGIADSIVGEADSMIQEAGSREEPVLRIVMRARSRPKPPTGENFFMEASPEEAGAGREPGKTIGFVCIGLSMKPMLAFIATVQQRMVLFLAGTLGLSLLLSLAFAMFITRPIAPLMTAIEAIRKGDLDYRIRISSNDEIGQVAEAFNQMTLDLRSTQDKVVRSEKLAAIGQLASGVGHELRNPLGVIQNAVYYLRDVLMGTPLAAQDPSIGEFLDLAEKEIKSANYIIKDLMDFARIPVLELQKTDINALLRGLKSVISIPESVRWIEELAVETPQASIDPIRMQQVFINLATNAIQAMPKGGELRVSTLVEKNGDPQSWIQVGFQDTGTGMSEETRKKIFEPLYTTKAKGTGLGLAISQGIVERHGGRIEVSSELGKGTLFTVKIPVREAA